MVKEAKIQAVLTRIRGLDKRSRRKAAKPGQNHEDASRPSSSEECPAHDKSQLGPSRNSQLQVGPQQSKEISQHRLVKTKQDAGHSSRSSAHKDRLKHNNSQAESGGTARHKATRELHKENSPHKVFQKNHKGNLEQPAARAENKEGSQSDSTEGEYEEILQYTTADQHDEDVEYNTCRVASEEASLCSTIDEEAEDQSEYNLSQDENKEEPRHHSAQGTDAEISEYPSMPGAFSTSAQQHQMTLRKRKAAVPAANEDALTHAKGVRTKRKERRLSPQAAQVLSSRQAGGCEHPSSESAERRVLSDERATNRKYLSPQKAPISASNFSGGQKVPYDEEAGGKVPPKSGAADRMLHGLVEQTCFWAWFWATSPFRALRSVCKPWIVPILSPLLALFCVLLVLACILNAVISAQTVFYNGLVHLGTFGLCRSHIPFPYRGEVCEKYTASYQSLPQERFGGTDFTDMGSQIGAVMDQNGYSKRVPYTMLSVMDAVSTLRRTVRFSELDSNTKEILDAFFEDYMENAKVASKYAQQFTGSVEMTVNTVLFQTKVAIRELSDIEMRISRAQDRQASIWGQIVSWLSGNHMVYLWGGMDPFLPVPFAHEADARSIARLRSWTDNVLPEVQRDIVRSAELSERFAKLELLSDSISNTAASEKKTELAKKTDIIKARGAWERARVAIGRGGNDIAEMVKKEAILISTEETFHDSASFYRQIHNVLTGVEVKLTALETTCDRRQYLQRMERKHLAIGSGQDMEAMMDLDISREVKNIIMGMENSTMSLQKSKAKWDGLQEDFASKVFGPNKIRSGTRKGSKTADIIAFPKGGR